MKKTKPIKEKVEALPEPTVDELERLIKKQELQTLILKKIIEKAEDTNKQLNK